MQVKMSLISPSRKANHKINRTLVKKIKINLSYKIKKNRIKINI